MFLLYTVHNNQQLNHQFADLFGRNRPGPVESSSRSVESDETGVVTGVLHTPDTTNGTALDCHRCRPIDPPGTTPGLIGSLAIGVPWSVWVRFASRGPES